MGNMAPTPTTKIFYDPLADHRLTSLEKSKAEHEERLRALEIANAVSKTKMALFGFVGSTVGGAVVAGIVSYLTR